VTHRHSHHTVCDGLSGVTEEGYLPSVPVCLVSGIGSAVRVGQGVFSVFLHHHQCVLAAETGTHLTGASRQGRLGCQYLLLLF
jgi:hypothetical protein